jgi:ligand-binding sensor domain-containing protein
MSSRRSSGAHAKRWIASAGIAALLMAAMPTGALGRPIRFERLSQEEGLSQSTVMCILQDSRGFIWLGTEAGLNRYDGRSVTVYRRDLHNTGSLTSDFVQGLAEDPSGDLWVATEGGGLVRWERATDRFVRYGAGLDKGDGPGSAQLRTVYLDRKGVLWVGTKDAGLARRDPKSGRWQRFTHSEEDPSSLCDDGVYAIFEDGAGRLWIGTNAGLARFDAASGRFQNFRHDPKNPGSLSADRIRGIRGDRQGRRETANPLSICATTRRIRAASPMISSTRSSKTVEAGSGWARGRGCSFASPTGPSRPTAAARPTSTAWGTTTCCRCWRIGAAFCGSARGREARRASIPEPGTSATCRRAPGTRTAWRTAT